MRGRVFDNEQKTGPMILVIVGTVLCRDGIAMYRQGSLSQLHVLFLHFLIKDLLKGEGFIRRFLFLAATGCGRY